MKKDDFIKNVSIVDEEAGDKLEDIINMSLAVQKYADLIHYGDAYARTTSPSTALIRIFLWSNTIEGHDYWEDIYNKLREAYNEKR